MRHVDSDKEFFGENKKQIKSIRVPQIVCCLLRLSKTKNHAGSSRDNGEKQAIIHQRPLDGRRRRRKKEKWEVESILVYRLGYSTT